jgi:hypothetical protein
MDPMLLAAAFGTLTREDGQRFDANETAFLTRQIEVVRNTVYEVRYPNLLARSFLPTATDIPSWASHVVQVILDSAGQAKVISNAADDIPRVDTVQSEESFKVVSLSDAWGYSLMDLRQAVATGQPLNDRRARMARRAIETAVDEILATGKLTTYGQPSLGLVGFLNSASVPIVTSSYDWDTATADEILADLDALVVAPSQATYQLYETNTLLLPPKRYDQFVSKRIPDTNMTVLKFFLETHPGVSVQKWYRLNGAGASSKDRCVAYHKSPEVVEAVVPLEFEQLAPQIKNLQTEVICHARCGGIQLHQPKGIAYMDQTAPP